MVSSHLLRTGKIYCVVLCNLYLKGEESWCQIDLQVVIHPLMQLEETKPAGTLSTLYLPDVRTLIFERSLEVCFFLVGVHILQSLGLQNK
jgi:hypothetical protein